MLITIDGLDGSGKETLSRRLVDTLKYKTNKEIYYLSFPDYSNSSGLLIYGLLHGNRFSTIGAGEAKFLYAVPGNRRRYFMSELFAINRHELFLNQPMKPDGIYIADRYAKSNLLYQGKDDPNPEVFAKYLTELEYVDYNNPQADLSFFLHVPYEVLRERLDKRDELDLYEQDDSLKNTYDFSEMLIHSYKAFEYVIEGTKDGQAIPVDTIINEQMLPIILERVAK